MSKENCPQCGVNTKGIVIVANGFCSNTCLDIYNRKERLDLERNNTPSAQETIQALIKHNEGEHEFWVKRQNHSTARYYEGIVRGLKEAIKQYTQESKESEQ